MRELAETKRVAARAWTSYFRLKQLKDADRATREPEQPLR
jgi:hypothetical protein